jgi:hypothetical protein
MSEEEDNFSFVEHYHKLEREWLKEVQKHAAELLEEALNEHYPEFKGRFKVEFHD